MEKLSGKKNTAVLISGRGSNLRSLVKYSKTKKSLIRIVLVVSNNFSAKGLDYANKSNINNVFINQGPGKYTSIRSAISIVKAMKISKNINVYGYYSKQIINNNYDILIDLLAEGRLTKDFIQPKYSN